MTMRMPARAQITCLCALMVSLVTLPAQAQEEVAPTAPSPTVAPSPSATPSLTAPPSAKKARTKNAASKKAKAKQKEAKPVSPSVPAPATGPVEKDPAMAHLFLMGVSTSYNWATLLNAGSAPKGLAYTGFFTHLFPLWSVARPYYELGLRYESLVGKSKIGTTSISEKYTQSAVLVGAGFRFQPGAALSLGLHGLYEWGISPKAELKSENGSMENFKLKGSHRMGIVIRPLYHVTDGLRIGLEGQFYQGVFSYKKRYSLWGVSAGLVGAWEF